jgi:hypothetical protein
MNSSDQPRHLALGPPAPKTPNDQPIIYVPSMRNEATAILNHAEKWQGRKDRPAEYHLHASRQPGFFKTAASILTSILTIICKIMKLLIYSAFMNNP